MPNALIFIILFMLFSCLACEQDKEKKRGEQSIEEKAYLSVVDSKPKVDSGLKRGDLFRVEVQNLRLREHQQLDAKVLPSFG